MATLATLKQSAIDYLAAKITDSTATSEELVLQTKAISQLQEVETSRLSGKKVLSNNDIDFSEAQVFVKQMTSDTSLTFSNFNEGETRDLLLSGNFTPTYPIGVEIVQGTYDGGATNVIRILCVDKDSENFYLFINPDTNLIVTDNITDSSITNAKIADSSITNAKIADNSIDSEHYVDGSIDAEHLSDDSISYNKLANEFTTSAVISASDVDFSAAQIFTKTLTANTTFTFSNASIGMVKDLVITGDFTLTFPTGSKVATGTYDGTVSNLIQVLVAGAADYWITISQEAL